MTSAPRTMNASFDVFRERHQQFLQSQLNNFSPLSQSLNDAMEYAVLLGGKRARPILVYAVGDMLGARLDDLDAPAAAIECIHAYSLVHDDLPAMDNDTLRRGKPTCHIQFDHATAILAGDALQTLGFDIISSHSYQAVPPAQVVAMIRCLSHASGYAGMCGGQALDLAATGQQINQAALETIHQYKTGALISAAAELGLLCAGNDDTATRKHLLDWAQTLGLAFQVQDDILDEIGDTAILGKQQGSDRAQQKSTYPALLGLEQAQQYLHDLHQKALHALAAIPYNSALLREFTDYLITRDR